MIEAAELSVLHFEDDRLTQSLLRKRLKKKYNARIRTESTLLNIEALCNTHLVQNFDFIICDFMFPTVSAQEKLDVLADCKKYIIFYTCLDKIDFQERCHKGLGFVPSNFIHCRKAHPRGLDYLLEKIDQIINTL